MSHLTTLPTEILLTIIPQIPYTPSAHANLHLTSTRLHQILTTHETTLVRASLAHQTALSAQSQFYPSLALKTYSGLHTLHSRKTALARLRSNWRDLTNRHDVRWLRCTRWTRILHAGLLTLYTLQDSGATPEAKAAHLGTLPATSLACVHFALVAALAVLRATGPKELRREHVCHCALVLEREAVSEDEARRREWELGCEELILTLGPEFLFKLFDEGSEGSEGLDKAEGWATRALRAEMDNFEERQRPWADGTPKAATLVAGLRRVFAERAGCGFAQTKGKMWEVLSATGFDCVDDGMLAAIVSGQKVEQGGKRMGF